MLIQILGLTLIGSVISLLGGLVLLSRKEWYHHNALWLTSFSAGVLLSAAFLDLFPEATHHFEELGQGDAFGPALAGIVLFFLLERTLFWFHHHHTDHGVKPTVWMITIGDGLHNFIDGVAIAATFMINPALGMTTTLAVAAHEIPQEIADFSVLLSKGLTRLQAIYFNVSSALTAVFGALLMYFFADRLESHLPVIIAFTAGMFAYISLSDLIPELHHTHNRREALPQVIAFLLGIGIVFILKSTLGEIAHFE